MNIQEIAHKATDVIYDREPALWERYGEKGKKKCLEDNEHHLKQLITATDLGQSKFFTDYAHWLNGILVKHGMSTKHLIDNFRILQELLSSDSKTSKLYRDYLELAIQSLHS